MLTTAPRPAVGARLPRAGLAALGLSLALVAAACGGTGGSPGAGSPDIASPGGASLGGASPSALAPSPDLMSPSASATSDTAGGGTATAEDPCSLLTADEVAGLVGGDVTANGSDQPIGGVCTYTPSAPDSRGFATLTVFSDGTDEVVDDAIADFTLEEVPGVGDRAAGIDGTIFVKTGTTVFSIVATDGTFRPVPLDALEEAASTIVEKLGGTNAPSAPSGSPEASPSPSA